MNKYEYISLKLTELWMNQQHTSMESIIKSYTYFLKKLKEMENE